MPYSVFSRPYTCTCKPAAAKVGKQLAEMGYSIVATGGTWDYLNKNGVPAERVNKVREGRPHSVDKMVDGAIHMVINTTQGSEAIRDSFSIRRTALTRGLPYYTTMSAARAAVGALVKLRSGAMTVCSMQEFLEEQRNG